MRNKKGISLIVLVITIIVMIILAAAVVVSLNNNGIIDKANHAVQVTDEKQMENLDALEFADEYLGKPIYSLADLRTAVTEGGKVVLKSDITIPSDNLLYKADGGHSDGSAFIIKADTVINLNGHNIIFDAPSNASDLFFVNGGHTLTIKGDGDITADCGIYVAYDEASIITVEGGNHTVTANNDMLYAIYGKINVSGGTFSSVYSNIINISGSGRNYLVDVSGGMFKNWNPASSPDGNLLAEGYKSVPEVIDGVTWYSVVAE